MHILKLLELFCGTKSITKAFKERNHETTTMDIDAQFEPDLVMDIMEFDPSQWREGYFDVIWASPPCQKFSVSTLGRNWKVMDDTLVPKTPEAEHSIAMVKKTIEIIKYLKPKLYFIENPMGALRKMYFMKELPRHTLTYCQYGDTRQKKTDIWSNSKAWHPKQPCKPNDPCHEPAKRGSRTGTQGLKNAVERGVIPPELCKEICLACEKELINYER